MELKKLGEMQNKGTLVVLDANRVGGGSIKNQILPMLSGEALSLDEVSKKLGMETVRVRNILRRYEKTGLIVAFSVEGKTLFVEKNKAKSLKLV